MKDLLSIIYLIIIVPSLAYVGLSLYSDEKINENIGLMIILMAFLMLLSFVYIIYQNLQKLQNN